MSKRSHSTGKPFNPETLALGYGYEPRLSEGAVKPPVFLTSTFQFASAEDGKRFFELAYGLREPDDGEQQGLIYSRLNNPNMQIFEERMAAWDQCELGATFASGMAAISTTMLALLRPGDVVISTEPIYGGTYYLFRHILSEYGIDVRLVAAGDDAPARMREAAEQAGAARVRVLYLETPANPNLVHTDIAAIAQLGADLRAAHGGAVTTVVDNTLLGPLFQLPATMGADIVIYSATKFIGGHSDLIAGVASGPRELMVKVLSMRTILGTGATPFNGWLLLRSLETLSVRMRRQQKNARALAQLLAEHPMVESVSYPGLLAPNEPQHALWQKQCTGSGSMIAFHIKGGQAAAYRVLDSFEVARLAVSLGGTETLVEHPMTMTHADVPPAELEARGVGPGLIRMSVGLEHLSDLKRDLVHALRAAEG
ncbi:MAG: PLP-dependent transferase [Myxococcales bacterium]|nr:PLP-dependent transferase [Myxococcales bacterium]